MKNRFLLLAAACGAMVLLSPAHAGRPLQTEDAGLLERGACELEGAGLRLSSDEGRATEIGLGLGCGIGFNSQLGLGASQSREVGQNTTGVDIGGKTGVWAGEGDAASEVAIAWSLGATREDSHWRYSETSLNLVGSIPLEPVTLHLNLGHAREVPSRIVSTTWGVAVEHDGFDIGELNWAPMAELFGDDRGDPWGNIAARFTLVPERFFVDVSWGRSLGESSEQLFTAGFKLAF
jgi:hypothetical protein